MSEQKKPEGIRAWYNRTISKSKRGLFVATAASTVVLVLMLLFAPTPLLARLQTANGALTIPLYGGLWIFFFIFMFLVPSREASFRAQESIDELREEVLGAVEIWKSIGRDVQKELPMVLSEFRETITEVRGAITTIKDAAVKNEKFIEESKPVIEALLKIEKRIEHEIESGFVEDFRDMTKAVKVMAGVPLVKKSDPNLSAALKSISKKKEPV